METFLSTEPAQLPARLQSIIALLAPDCSTIQAEQLLSEDSDLFETAQREHVAAVLWDRWSGLLTAHLTAEAHGRWRQLMLSSAALVARRRGEALRVLGALGAAGVPPVVMRGMWLAEAVYPDPTLRPYVDVDIIVPIDSLPAVAQAMAAAGYVCEDDAIAMEPEAVHRMLSRGHYNGLGAWFRDSADGQTEQFDLHTSLEVVHGGWWPWRASPEWIADRSEPWQVDGAAMRAFVPDAALIALCENICRHGLARWTRRNLLIRYYDVLLTCSLISEEGWERLISDARELRLNMHIALVLRKVEQMWQACWPASVVERLEANAYSSRLARYAAERPGWLGLRGRIALFHAASTSGPAEFASFLLRNSGMAARSLLSRG